MVITEAWAKHWHSAKVISEQCDDGFLCSYSCAAVDEPDVGIPHILKHILRIFPPARAVNREPALFGANHELAGS